MRISDWSSDVCSSDLPVIAHPILDSEAGEPAKEEHHAALGKRRGGRKIFLAALLPHLGKDGGEVRPCLDFLAILVLRRREALEIGRASCRERVCQYV